MCVFGTKVWFKPPWGLRKGHGSLSRFWMLTLHSLNSRRTMSWNWHWWYDSRFWQTNPMMEETPQWWVRDTMGRCPHRNPKNCSVFWDKTRLQWGSTMKLVPFWGWQSSAENLGIQEWTNEWMTAYLHVVGEGKLTIMSYVMICHDFTFVNASRGEVSGVFCSRCFHMYIMYIFSMQGCLLHEAF